MRQCFVLLLGLLLGACSSTPTISNQYPGNDRGATVVGIGAPPGYHYTRYSFLFRNVGGPAATAAPVGRFEYKTNSFLSGDSLDYRSDRERGVVVTATLPPGRYEIFEFHLFFTNGMYSETFRSSSPFSIPFEVRAGETAYLGNYFALPRYGARRLGVAQRAGALFTIENRQAVEMPIASKKALGSLSTVVTSYTPSADQLAAPFITHEQRQRIELKDQED
jgi:hypothetical protein